MENEKIKALSQYLDVDEDEIQEGYGKNIYTYYGEEYEVLTDSEAGDRWEEELDNYIEECILLELPDNLQNYFDEDAWEIDAKFDGRGHCLSRYDGDENEVK